MIATYDHAFAIGFGLLETDFTDNRGVCDSLATIWWYVFVANDMESVGAVDTLASV